MSRTSGLSKPLREAGSSYKLGMVDLRSSENFGVLRYGPKPLKTEPMSVEEEAHVLEQDALARSGLVVQQTEHPEPGPITPFAIGLDIGWSNIPHPLEMARGNEDAQLSQRCIGQRCSVCSMALAGGRSSALGVCAAREGADCWVLHRELGAADQRQQIACLKQR
jgi:hypothetical protein